MRRARVAFFVSACALSVAACLVTVDESKLETEKDAGGDTAGGAVDASVDRLHPRPGAANTGVPADASLTTVDASAGYAITEGGVTANLDIKGCVAVRANGVVLRSTRINCTMGSFGLVVDPGFAGLVVEDVEISGGTIAGVGPGNFTARRVDIHDFGRTGVELATASITDSFVHAPTPTSRAAVECHGGADVVVQNVFIDARGPTLGVNALRVTSEVAPVSNVAVTGCVLAGGPPVVFVAAGDAGKPGISIVGNRIVPPATGDVHDLDPGVKWQDNVDDTDGGLIP